MFNESILSYMPPKGDKKSYRLQASLSLEEAAEIEKIVANPTMPFEGDWTTIIRTFVRAGIAALHIEHQVSTDSFIQAMRPVVGSTLLTWSLAKCDEFALASCDHLRTSLQAGDPMMGDEVLHQVIDALQEIKNNSARVMLKTALTRRGFLEHVAKLREFMLEENMDVYYLDTTIAEVFS